MIESISHTDSMLAFPLLSSILILFLLGSLVIWLVREALLARVIALSVSFVGLILSLILINGYDPSNGQFQFVERLPWITSLHIEYIVGIDGISILFLPLTNILFIGIILASWTSIRTMPKLFYTLMLVLQFATIGIFISLNTILFFLFWELTLVPIYFLINYWGVGPNRRYAAVKYTLVMIAGGLPILFGFIILAVTHGQVSDANGSYLVFDYIRLLENRLPLEAQVSIFFLLLIGFAFKAPIFPFHTWLPAIVMEGPASIAAIMTGLKLGAYGLIRFLMPLTPDASQNFHLLLVGLGITGVLYGAILAITQTNLRKMLAFSSLSHVGLVVLGIASFSTQGIQGALFQLYNFTIVAGGLFLLIGFLQHRLGSTEISSLGGIAKTMPIMASLFFIFGLASLGVPGTNGFVAENLILISVLQTHTGAGLAALFAIIIAAAYFFNIYRQSFLGPVRHATVEQGMDLKQRELVLILGLTLLIFIGGIFPNLILDITYQSSNQWLTYIKQ